MKKILSYLFPQTIAVYHSDYNGEIYIKEFLGDMYMQVEKLTQSGETIRRLCSKACKVFGLGKSLQPIKSILLLGVGGGTMINMLKSYFPDAHITGFDIDPIMLGIAKKHFGIKPGPKLLLKKGDIFDLKIDLGTSYDLVIVDIFRGYSIPKELSSKTFLTRIKSILSPEGSVIFNRLYFNKYIVEAHTFIDLVEEVFEDVDVAHVEMNIFIHAS